MVVINMARNYTSINHCALSSDTLAEANDATQALFWRLLCVSDDWGRFPNNPAKLKRMMQDFNHTEEQIAVAVKHFIDHGSIAIYSIDNQDICEWNKWDDYQTMRWKNEAGLPNRDGKFEASTNPLSDRPSKKKHILTNPNISYPIQADDSASVSSKAKDKGIHKTGHKTDKSADVLPGWCYKLLRELFPGMKQIKINKPGDPPDVHPEAYRQAQALERLHRIDGHPQDVIESVLRWAKADTGNGDWPGWSAQFHSCAPLRNKRDGVSKFTKMKAGYDSRKSAGDDLVIG